MYNPGIILIVIAITIFAVLFVPCLLIGTVISLFKHEGNLYYKQIAIGIDHLLNVVLQHLINLTCFTKDSKHLSGNIKESVSGVLGWNKRSNTLTKFGMWWCNRLGQIEKDHVEKSIDDTIK